MTSIIDYSDEVKRRFQHPQHTGSLDKNSKQVGTGLVGAPACGDVLQLQFEVEDNVVKDAKFKTFGCGAAIASSDLAAEWLKGKTLEQVAAIKNKDIAAELALPPIKLHCSVLAEEAIQAALQDYQHKQQTTNDTENTSAVDAQADLHNSK